MQVCGVGVSVSVGVSISANALAFAVVFVRCQCVTVPAACAVIVAPATPTTHQPTCPPATPSFTLRPFFNTPPPGRISPSRYPFGSLTVFVLILRLF